MPFSNFRIAFRAQRGAIPATPIVGDRVFSIQADRLGSNPLINFPLDYLDGDSLFPRVFDCMGRPRAVVQLEGDDKIRVVF